LCGPIFSVTNARIDFPEADWLGSPVIVAGAAYDLSPNDLSMPPPALGREHSILRRFSKGTVMNTGTVKWFNSQKGYGFIQPDNGGADVFVHISAVERAGMTTLNEGQKISYEVLADRRTGKSAAGNLSAA
jgi:CspA family cold shock protein